MEIKRDYAQHISSAVPDQKEINTTERDQNKSKKQKPPLNTIYLFYKEVSAYMTINKRVHKKEHYQNRTDYMQWLNNSKILPREVK